MGRLNLLLMTCCGGDVLLLCVNARLLYLLPNVVPGLVMSSLLNDLLVQMLHLTPPKPRLGSLSAATAHEQSTRWFQGVILVLQRRDHNT